MSGEEQLTWAFTVLVVGSQIIDRDSFFARSQGLTCASHVVSFVSASLRIYFADPEPFPVETSGKDRWPPELMPRDVGDRGMMPFGRRKKLSSHYMIIDTCNCVAS